MYPGTPLFRVSEVAGRERHWTRGTSRSSHMHQDPVSSTYSIFPLPYQLDSPVPLPIVVVALLLTISLQYEIGPLVISRYSHASQSHRMRRQDNHQATYEEQFTHAEMTGLPSTPPPRSHVDRPRTPDAPLHGPLHDNYEPYTPRRSTRSTAHNNPYSSLNTGHGSPRKTHVARDTLPPSTARKSRAQPIGAHPSPPSSPNSPSIAPHKTPKKTPRPGSLQPKAPPPSWDPTGMLPTPSKTPKKRTAAITSTAHMLNFQPADANDIMPTPRRMKKHAKTSSISALALGENSGAADGMIDVYTDSNARVPEMDESEENPFIGPRKQAAKAQERGRRTQHRSQRRVSDEVEMEERVQNEEGMIYVLYVHEHARSRARPLTRVSYTLTDILPAAAERFSAPSPTANRSRKRTSRTQSCARLAPPLPAHSHAAESSRSSCSHPMGVRPPLAPTTLTRRPSPTLKQRAQTPAARSTALPHTQSTAAPRPRPQAHPRLPRLSHMRSPRNTAQLSLKQLQQWTTATMTWTFAPLRSQRRQARAARVGGRFRAVTPSTIGLAPSPRALRALASARRSPWRTPAPAPARGLGVVFPEVPPERALAEGLRPRLEVTDFALFPGISLGDPWLERCYRQAKSSQAAPSVQGAISMVAGGNWHQFRWHQVCTGRDASGDPRSCLSIGAWRL